MSENIRIAIILPVYNTAPYLRECLHSILNQEHQNFVIFAINDGSTDESKSILEEYSHQSNKIRLTNISNSGVSFARNIALEQIEQDGRFDLITFCDSDDIISPKLLTTYAKTQKQLQTHFITVGYQSFDKTGLLPKKQDMKHPPLLINDSSILKFGFSSYLKNSPARSKFTGNTCFDSKIILGLRFDTSKKIAEDQDFRFRALLRCKKSVIISDLLYFYRIRKSSLSHSLTFNTADLSLYIEWLTQLNGIPISIKPTIEKLAFEQWQHCVKQAYEFNVLEKQWGELKNFLNKIDAASEFTITKYFSPKMILFRCGPRMASLYFKLIRRNQNSRPISKKTKQLNSFD